MPEMSSNGGLHTDSVALFFTVCVLRLCTETVSIACRRAAWDSWAGAESQSNQSHGQSAMRPRQIPDYVTISHACDWAPSISVASTAMSASTVRPLLPCPSMPRPYGPPSTPVPQLAQ